MSDYIPFDLGTWQSDAGRECPRHGRQHGGLAIAVSPRPGETITRQYCGLCVLQALERATAWEAPP